MTDADLTQRILALTSGSACEHLRPLACDYVDGLLERTPRQLVEGHLAHCEHCTSLVAQLRSSRVLLPVFANATPGPWFTQQVLRACAVAPARSWWSRLMCRPRIALEVAYLATALFVVGVCLPSGGDRDAALGFGARAVAHGLHAVADAITTTEPSPNPLRPLP